MSDSSKAFREGKRARRRGYEEWANPYTHNLYYHNLWIEGWKEEDELIRCVPPAIAIPKEVKYY